MIQIKDIILYGFRDDQIRVLKLKTNDVNLIIGESHTGKSALIDIIDYCFGSPDFKVEKNFIAKNVLWFVLKIKVGNDYILIGRKNPEKSNSTNQSYIETCNVDYIPDVKKIKENATIDMVKRIIAERMGILLDDGKVVIKPEHYIPSITLRHSLFYSFQSSDDIISNKYIFFGQNELYVEQAIKKTLPYFLGAFGKEEIEIQKHLDGLRDKKREINRQIRDYEKIVGKRFEKGYSLISEAIKCNLILEENRSCSPEEIIPLLSKLVESQDRASKIINEPQIFELRKERNEILDKIDDIKRNLVEINGMCELFDNYKAVSTEGLERLHSINIFKEMPDSEAFCCPLCNTEITGMSSSIKMIKEHADDIRERLGGFGNDYEDMKKYSKLKQDELKLLKGKLGEITAKIDGLYKEDLRKEDSIISQSKTLGRISLWIENLEVVDSYKLKKLEKAFDENIKDISKKLTDPLVKVDTLLSSGEIGTKITSNAYKLKLDCSDKPIAFNLKKCTIIGLDVNEEPIFFENIGSTKNHIGYHLSVLFAFHNYFVKHQRPVPRFLIIDQPTMSQSSSARDESLDSTTIKNIREMLLNYKEYIGEEFQLIVFEHEQKGTFDEETCGNKIPDGIIWKTDGLKLIPDSWIEYK
ncbi:hypothetical protein MSSIT_1963 [Methanosarcina siciliae T4/M]|uniref:Rad50/SbcC-type AAA domain-containing protein n=1 Tax=Methanosarcina siciliae T4/M TaxID=1434120 RepID=A0A0E3P4K4_9EURY|nr:DUF3732 domain-containing protein [Methanosarcina siciliae]AKB28682.1 hypothetical protein MSSIT_1963 [Methanosarcina siciliae T4/M]